MSKTLSASERRQGNLLIAAQHAALAFEAADPILGIVAVSDHVVDRWRALIEAAPDLLTACKRTFDLIEAGVLVRDITRDDEPSWALRAASLVRDLAQLQAAIQKAEGR